MTLSDRMIEYRARENISQAELAVRVGVDRTTINKAENGWQVSRLTEAKIEIVLKGKALRPHIRQTTDTIEVGFTNFPFLTEATNGETE